MLFTDKANNSIESAPQPPPRRTNPRQNPFNRPAPPPPPPAYTEPSDTASNSKGNYRDNSKVVILMRLFCLNIIVFIPIALTLIYLFFFLMLYMSSVCMYVPPNNSPIVM